jgi:hypothetical protein
LEEKLLGLLFRSFPDRRGYLDPPPPGTLDELLALFPAFGDGSLEFLLTADDTGEKGRDFRPVSSTLSAPAGSRYHTALRVTENQKVL